MKRRKRTNDKKNSCKVHETREMKNAIWSSVHNW